MDDRVRQVKREVAADEVTGLPWSNESLESHISTVTFDTGFTGYLEVSPTAARALEFAS